MKRKGARVRTVIIEAALLALLLFLFARAIDPGQIRAGAQRITPGAIAGVVGFQAALILLATLCWSLLLHAAGIGRSFGWTLRANLGGFAVTWLTPAISCSGAPVRAAQYRAHGMRPEAIYATIALDTLVLAAGKIPTISIGAAVLVTRAGTTAAVVMGGVLLVLLAAIAWLLASMMSGAGYIVRAARRMLRPFARIRPRRAVAILGALRAFSVSMAEIGGDRKAVGVALCVAVLIGMLEVLQNLFILSLVGTPSLGAAFAIQSGILVQAVTGLLPGNAGGMEAANAAAFTLLGLAPSTSLVFTLIMRLGQLSLVMAGLAVLLASRARGAILRQGVPRPVRQWKGTETAARVGSSAYSNTRAGRAGYGDPHAPGRAEGRVRESL